MHTPHGPGLNNLNVEARLPAASTEAVSKLTAPGLDRVIASPEAWCLFAVDYSHLSNVTARQLTQLLGQAGIHFIYSAGHNLEYIWVISPNSSFTCILTSVPLQVHKASSPRVLDILNSAKWKEQAKTRPREQSSVPYSMSFTSPITPESLPAPGFVNRHSRRDPSPPKAMPSIRILPHTFISHGLNDLESDWREKIAKLLTRGASLLRERSSSVKTTTSAAVPPIVRLHPIPFQKGHASRPSVPPASVKLYTPPSPRVSAQMPTGPRPHALCSSPTNRRWSNHSGANEEYLGYRSAHTHGHARPVAVHTVNGEMGLLSQRLSSMSLHKLPPLRSSAAPTATTLVFASANSSPSHLHSPSAYPVPPTPPYQGSPRPTTPVMDFDSNPFFSYTELGPFPHNASTREVNFTARGRLVGHLFDKTELSGSMYIVTSDDDFEGRYKEHHHAGEMEIPKYYPRRDEGDCPDYKCLRIDFDGIDEDGLSPLSYLALFLVTNHLLVAVELTCQYSQLLAERDIEHSRISTPSTASFLVRLLDFSLSLPLTTFPGLTG